MACIVANPDIAGIGVRTAVYAQNLLSFPPAFYALVTDWKVTDLELESLEEQSVTILISAFALLVSTIIQASTIGLSSYHIAIILNLSWINNTNAFIYLLLYFVRKRVNPWQRRTLDAGPVLEDSHLDTKGDALGSTPPASPLTPQFESSGAPSNDIMTYRRTLWSWLRPFLSNQVVLVGSIHLTLMAAVGLWFWVSPTRFGISDCQTVPIVVVVGGRVSLASATLQRWSLVVYGAVLFPAVNLIIPSTLFWGLLDIPVGRLSKRVGSHFPNLHVFPAFFGLACLIFIIAMLMLDTELIIHYNRMLLKPGEDVWTFGQTLALLLLLAAFRTIGESFRAKRVRRLFKTLCQAAALGDVPLAEYTLSRGVSIHTLDERKRTALTIATQANQWSFVQALVTKLPEYDPGKFDRSPKKKGHKRPTQSSWWSRIISHFRPKHRRSHQDSRAELNGILQIAALNGAPAALKVVDCVLTHGAEVNARDRHGCTPILNAARRENWDIVKRLISAGARLIAEDRGSVLTLATNAHEWEVVMLVVRSAPRYATYSEELGVTFLVAITIGDEDVVNYLIANKLDKTNLNRKSSDGRSGILIAAENRNWAIVKALMKDGAQVGVKDAQNRTLLLVVAQAGEWKLVIELVQHNALPKGRGKDGASVMLLAAQAGQWEVMNVLATNGVHEQLKDEHGITPLMIAAQEKQSSTVELLVTERVEMNIDEQDAVGDTAIIFAAIREAFGIVRYLAERGAKLNVQGSRKLSPLMIIAGSGDYTTTRVLVDLGSSLSLQDENNDTALHHALRNAPMIQSDEVSLPSGAANTATNDEERKFQLTAQGERRAVSDGPALPGPQKEEPSSRDAKGGANKNEPRRPWDVVRYLLEKTADADINIYGKNKTTFLMVATERKNLKIIKTLVHKGASMDMQDADGNTALHISLNPDQLSIVKYLIDKGANLDLQDDRGRTPLMLATTDGNFEFVKLLVEKGASLDTRDKSGDTAVHLAVDGGNISTLRYFADKKANLDIPGSQEATPLMRAAVAGHLDLVQFLVENKVSLDAQDEDGDTALQNAASSEQWDIVSYLVEQGAALDTDRTTRPSTMMRIAQAGNLELIESLASKARMDFKTDDGDTIAHYAAFSPQNPNSSALMEFLVQHGVPIDTPGSLGRTPLIEAANSGNLFIVAFLVGKSVDLNTQDASRHTAILNAAHSENWDIVQYLAKRGADVNIRDAYGLTVLDGAMEANELESIKVLVENGAPVGFKAEKNGDTPLSVSLREKAWDLTEYLVENGCDINNGDLNPLLCASENGQLALVRLLIDKGASLESSDQDGDTAVSLAVRGGHLEVLKYLVQKGANLNTQDSGKRTPLMRAADAGDLELLTTLIYAGASLDIPNKDGDTAISYAVGGNENQAAMTEILAKRGAKLDSRGFDGLTPLMRAAYWGYLDVAKVLVEYKAPLDLKNKDGQTAAEIAKDIGHLDVAEFLLQSTPSLPPPTAAPEETGEQDSTDPDDESIEGNLV